MAGRNQDLLSKLLSRGDDRQNHGYLKFYKENGHPEVTIENIEHESYYAKLRKSAIRQSQNDQMLRKINNTVFSDTEEILGVKLEYLEPQVRKAVCVLIKKGYKTFGSGFYGNAAQQTYLRNRRGYFSHESGFENYKPSSSLTTWLDQQGVRLVIENDAITFYPNGKFSLDDMENIWLKIAEDLPELKS